MGPPLRFWHGATRGLNPALCKCERLMVRSHDTQPNRSCIVNRQIGIGDSKNVIVFDSLLTGHVIRRMRTGRLRIFNGNQQETL